MNRTNQAGLLVVCLVVSLLIARLSNVPSHAQEPRSPSSLIWPTTSQVVREYDPPTPNWLPGHRGLDLKSTPGTQITSPADGQVIWKGTAGGVPILVISHGIARATYQPIASKLVVGAPVRAGQIIGRSSSGGHCADACLHWGLKIGKSNYLDPRLLLGPVHAVLIPD